MFAQTLRCDIIVGCFWCYTLSGGFAFKDLPKASCDEMETCIDVYMKAATSWKEAKEDAGKLKFLATPCSAQNTARMDCIFEGLNAEQLAFRNALAERTREFVRGHVNTMATFLSTEEIAKFNAYVKEDRLGYRIGAVGSRSDSESKIRWNSEALSHVAYTTLFLLLTLI